MESRDDLLATAPAPLRSRLLRHGETIRFLAVGGTCYLITIAVNYLLKLTVLTGLPTTALATATAIATALSYVLNREWSFRSRGGRARGTEILLFVLVNLIAIGITALPQYFARYALGWHTPNVGVATQEASDFVNGLVIGTALATWFRLWAFRQWVFPAATGQPAWSPTAALERSTLAAMRSASGLAAESTSSR